MRPKLYHMKYNAIARAVILQLLAESVRQPREPSHVHSHREVRPFRVAGRDMIRIRVADDPMFVAANAFAGAVARLRLGHRCRHRP